MKFSKLRILGFKTFVEPTEVMIRPGLTGVVGPNGCGKSNLVEALRWVMGENSYKNMRASGMDDVIFSGSGRRPGRNTAEVTLVLDNDQRTAPAAFNHIETLEITRRIERENGSVYRINGKEVRARDVQLLFADASTGSRSPSMVRQGQIGELIAAKPIQRRAILEEASGISGLHGRRNEAEMRLKAAEQNLEQVDTVLGQIDQRLETLKRQGKHAARYRALSSDIRAAEAIVHHVRWFGARAQVREAREALSAAERAAIERTEAQAKAATAQAVAAHELPALRDAEIRAAAALQRLKIAVAEIDAEEKRAKERLAELDRRLVQIEADIVREERLIADNGDALARLETEASHLQAEDATGSERALEARARLAGAETTLAIADADLAAATAVEAETAARRNQAERMAREASVRVEKLDSQIAEVERERLALAQRSDAGPVVAERRARLETAGTEAKAAEAAAVVAEEAAAKARQAEPLARGPLAEAERDLNRLETEARTLAKVLNTGGSDLWAPIVDRITVEKGFEAALGAALGEDLDVSTDEAAPVHWREPGLAADDPALPMGAEPLARIVKAPPLLARRLAQIGLIDKADGPRLARELKVGQRLVSKAGDLWRWDGYQAAAEAPTPAAQRLSQKNRLGELESLVNAARAITTERRGVLDAAASRAKAAGEAERQVREAAREAARKVNVARDQLAAAERDLAQVTARLSALEEAKVRLATSRAEAVAVAAEAKGALANLPPIAGLQAETSAHRARAAEARAALSEARSSVQTLEREAEFRVKRLEAIARERESWVARAANAEAQVATLKARRADMATERQTLAERPSDLLIERRRLLHEIGLADAARAEAADRLAKGETAQADADRAARVALDALSSAREAQARAEARVEAVVNRLQELEDGIRDAFELEPPALAAFAGLAPDGLLPNLEATELKLERLRQERERLGGVNLQADEEARDVEASRDALTKERADLEEAIRRLRLGISSLNREARERLMASFEVVNGHFQRLFTHLFGGGEARLQLIDSDDPLEAGLDILARPPGKKPATMTLLSGGEQALTAMALIFAVFLTNPSPICVLDEVDAPLDDANVERYCDLLDEMARSTQTRFVVITHNPITMSRMDRLYGVTMAERGVSQLVSVDLEQAERFKEAV